MTDLIDAGSERTSGARPRPGDRIDALLLDREQAGSAFFEQHAERIARLCHRMAERFARDGRLVAFGGGPSDRSDARHVAVEFVHPVIVGKRALPALGLAREGGRSPPRSCWRSRPTTSRSRSGRTPRRSLPPPPLAPAAA